MVTDIGTSFTVIALGSAELLTNVLNGLAMMSNDGTLSGMAKVAALGGLISIVFSGVISQKFEYYKLMTTFVIYSLLFGATATVKVEDIYTGEVTPVAHVPIGVALPMATASAVGYRLTKEMEMVFSLPGVSVKEGGVDALGWLARTRDLAFTDPRLSMTVSAYIKDCVLTSINSVDAEPDQITLDAWKTSEDLLTLMGKANYAAINTITYLPSDPVGGTVRPCADAYDAFQPEVVASMMNIATQRQLGAQLGIKATDNSGTPVADKLNEARNAIAGVNSNAQIYMLNAMVNNEFKCQTEGLNSASCITLTEGSERRRTQWASEQSFFKQVARPLMAFAEAFLPALAPMVLFVILVAPASVAILMTYFKLYASLALWTPLMALVNFYLVSAVSGHVKHMSATVDPNSVSYLDSTWTTIADWVSVGGMLYAAVPVLAYGIVTGTGGVMNVIGSKAGQASGGTDGSSTMSPALSQNSAVVASGPGMQVAPGVARSAMGAVAPAGAIQAMGVASLSMMNSTGTQLMSSAQQSLATAKTEQDSAQMAQSSALDKTLSVAKERGMTSEESSEFSKNYASTSSVIDSIAKNRGFNTKTVQGIQGAVGAVIAANAKVGSAPGGGQPAVAGAAPGAAKSGAYDSLLNNVPVDKKSGGGKGLPGVVSLGGSASASGSLSKTLGLTEEESDAILNAVKSDVGTNRGAAAAQKEAKKWTEGTNNRDATSFKAAVQATSNLSTANQRVAQKQDAYNEAATRAQSSGMSVNFSGEDLVNRAAADKSFQAGLVSGANRLDPSTYSAELKRAQQFGLRGSTAESTAALATFAKSGAYGQQELSNVMKMHGVTSEKQTAPVGSIASGSQNAELNKDVPFKSAADFDRTRQLAEAGGRAALQPGSIGASTQPLKSLPSMSDGAPAQAPAPAVAPRANPARALKSSNNAATRLTKPAEAKSGNNGAQEEMSRNMEKVDAMRKFMTPDNTVLNRDVNSSVQLKGNEMTDGSHASVSNAAGKVWKGITDKF